MTEAWTTDDDLRRAREHFTAGIDGWVQPVLHGVVTTSRKGEQRVQVVSGRDHRLPAIVLASVIGRSHGTVTMPVSVDELRRAIELLAQAEAATHVPHPNLWAWRRFVEEDHAVIEAVFVDSVDDDFSSEADRLLRAASL